MLSELVRIYGSQDLFVEEYQRQLAERLLAVRDYSVDREPRNVEMLRRRFGDAAMTGCDVMLHDVAEARRIDALLHAGPALADNPVHPHIISRISWPQMRAEDVVLPPAMQRCLFDGQ